MKQGGTTPAFNRHGVCAIYVYELIRFKRTIWQSLVTPVITTSLYFVVFGAAIGARMSEVGGVSYGAFIIPGLMLLAVLTESLTTSAFSIYMPRFIGTIYEVLSAPLSSLALASRRRLPTRAPAPMSPWDWTRPWCIRMSI